MGPLEWFFLSTYGDFIAIFFIYFISLVSTLNDDFFVTEIWGKPKGGDNQRSFCKGIRIGRVE